MRVLVRSVTADNCAELAHQPDADGFIETVAHQWAVLASLSWVCVLLGLVTAENCAELARQPDVDGFIEAVAHQWAVKKVKKVKFSHTRYRALGPELIPVYRQSARR